MFRVPSLHGLPKNGERGATKEARSSVLSAKFSPKDFQKISGKNIDGVGKRVLLRSSQDGAPAKAEDVTNQGRREFGSFDSFSEKFFEFFGKVIDEG